MQIDTLIFVGGRRAPRRGRARAPRLVNFPRFWKIHTRLGAFVGFFFFFSRVGVLVETVGFCAFKIWATLGKESEGGFVLFS